VKEEIQLIEHVEKIEGSGAYDGRIVMESEI